MMNSIMSQLRPLFSARRFLHLHTEMLIHHSRIRTLLGQMLTDTAQVKVYLNIHITRKLTPFVTDPVHLRQELLQINKQLPARLSLPEDPHGNVWHYYRFLTMNPVIHGGRLVLIIRIPLTDLDSVINLHKIYNLPMYNTILANLYNIFLKEPISQSPRTINMLPFYQIQNLLNVLWQMDIEYWPLPC